MILAVGDPLSHLQTWHLSSRLLHTPTVDEAKRHLPDRRIDLILIDDREPGLLSFCDWCKQVSPLAARVVVTDRYIKKESVIALLAGGAEAVATYLLERPLTEMAVEQILLHTSTTIEVGQLTLNMRTSQLLINGDEVTLGEVQYRIMVLFMTHPGVWISYDDIANHLGDGKRGAEAADARRATMSRLRKALRQAAGGEVVEAERLKGFRLRVYPDMG